MTLQSYKDRASNVIDNTPLAIAKEEGEAAEEARRRPMVLAVSTRDLIAHARTAAKLVFNGCEKIGMTKEEVLPMKKRMAAWMKIVDNYQKEIAALWQLDIPDGDRRGLLNDMLKARAEAFVDLFGE